MDVGYNVAGSNIYLKVFVPSTRKYFILLRAKVLVRVI